MKKPFFICREGDICVGFHRDQITETLDQQLSKQGLQQAFRIGIVDGYFPIDPVIDRFQMFIHLQKLKTDRIQMLCQSGDRRRGLWEKGYMKFLHAIFQIRQLFVITVGRDDIKIPLTEWKGCGICDELPLSAVDIVQLIKAVH